MAQPMVAIMLGLTGMVTSALLVGVWRLRLRLSTMTGMMVAMTGGMVTGLIVGTGAAPIVDNELWPATLIGVAAGSGAGLLLGGPVGLMAVLDGALAGLMGGMMGAMLGVMGPEATESAVLLLVALYLLSAAALAVLIGQETGGWFGRGRAFPLSLILLSSLLAGLTWSTRHVGTGAMPSQSHTSHGGMIHDQWASPIEIDLTAEEFRFDRQKVRVTRGQFVRLRLHNRGKAEHDLAVSGLDVLVQGETSHGTGVHVHTTPGTSEVIEFVPLASGQFEVVCTLPGHARAGMRMVLEVAEAN